mgnify:CR=1 FL=1
MAKNFGKRNTRKSEPREAPFIVKVDLPRTFPKDMDREALGYTVECEVVSALKNSDVKAGETVSITFIPDKAAHVGFKELGKANSDVFLLAGLAKNEDGHFVSKYPSGAGENNDRVFIPGVAARNPGVRVTTPEGSYNIRANGTGYNISAKSEMTRDEVNHVLDKVREALESGEVYTNTAYKIFSSAPMYLPEKAVPLKDNFEVEDLRPILDKYGAATVRVYDAGASEHNSDNAFSVFYRKDQDGKIVGGLSEAQEKLLSSMKDTKGDIIPTVQVSYPGSKEHPSNSQLMGVIENIQKAMKENRDVPAFVGGVAALRVVEAAPTHDDASSFERCSAAKFTGFAERDYNQFRGVESVLQLEGVIHPKYTLKGGKAEEHHEDSHATTPKTDVEVSDDDLLENIPF